MKIRKVLAILLAVILCIGLLSACGGSKDDGQDSKEVSVTEVKDGSEKGSEPAESKSEPEETASVSEEQDTKEDSASEEKKEGTDENKDGNSELPEDVTAESLLNGYFDSVDDIESLSYNCAILMDMTISLMGEEQHAEADIQISMESFGDNSHMTGQMKMDTDEGKEQEFVDQYITLEDGKYIVYSYDKDTDSWSKDERDTPPLSGDLVPKADPSDFTVEEAEGRYKVSGTVDLEKVFETLGESFGSVFGDFMGTGESVSGNADVEYWFNKDTKALEDVNIYMGQALKDMFTAMIVELMGSSDSDEEVDVSSFFDMDVEHFDILLTDFAFNQGKEIVLPATAAGAAEAEEKDEKGILEEEEEKLEEEAEEAGDSDSKDKKDSDDKSKTSSAEEGIEVIGEYLYDNSYSTLYYVLVKNNTKETVTITANGEAKNADGKVVGTADMYIDVLGPGETSGGSFYFDVDDEVTDVAYKLKYEEETNYKPVLSDLDIEQTFNDSNVVLVVTNNGKENAEFVSAQGIFLDKNEKVVGTSSAYLMDSDYQIKVGRSLAAQLDCYDKYDHAVIYLEGKSSGQTDSGDDVKVSASDFEINEYMYDTGYDVSMYFVTVTNNSKDTVSIYGNAVAKDKKGRPLAAGNLSIDVLAPGETSIGSFYFNGASDVDKVDYELDYSTDVYYKPVLKNISVKEIVDDKKVVVKLKNNGEDTAQFVEAIALFFDKKDNVIYSNSTYIGDDDYELKAGESLFGEISVYDEFDHVEVFLTGRAEK